MSSTSKVANISYYQNIALTIYDEVALQTVQLQGVAEVVTNDKLIKQIEDELRLIQPQNLGTKKPLVSKLAGETTIYRIVPTRMSFIDYLLV